MLQMRQPCFIAWGPEQISLYNDSYIPILGSKHPAGLGRPARELWSEVWETLGPINDAVLAGEARWFEDMPFTLSGRDRDVSWFSFSYTPLMDDDGKVAGIFCAANETSDKVLTAREAASERERIVRLFDHTPSFMALLEGPEHRFVMVNPAYNSLIGGRDVVGKVLREALPDAVSQGYLALLDQVYQSGVAYKSVGARFVGQVAPGAPVTEHFLDFVYQPVTDFAGGVTGIFVEGYDVTERVQAEASLRASEARYRALFEAIDDGFCIIESVDHEAEPDFRCIAANPAYETATGLRGVVGKTIRELVAAEAPGWIAIYAKVLATGVPIRFQRRLETTERELELLAFPVADGEKNRVAVLFRDITDRVRREVNRLALLKLGDCIREMDDPEALSHAAAKILAETFRVSRAGYGTVNTRAETITIDRDWNAPGVRSIAGLLYFREHGSYIDDLKRGETVVVTDSRADPRTASNSRRLEAISARSFINMPVTEQGDFVALLFLNHAEAREWSGDELALVREFAERTRTAVARLVAEKELRRLAASLEQQVEERTADLDRVWRNSRDLLVVVGADGIFRMANPAWTSILGLEPHEVVGRSYRDLVWPEDVGETQDGLNRASSGGDLTGFENRYRHKDGTARWISWHTMAEGDVVYAYGRDVTASKLAAAELSQAQEALRQAQKLEAIGQLTGGVAHDFNNLLTIIKSSSDLLRRPNLSEERRRKYIDAISDTVSRASRLTGQLLAFARRQSLAVEVFDVAKRVRSIAEMLATIVGSRIKISVDVPVEALWTEADASQFETALVNLVVNARDAMNGHGRLNIQVGEVRHAASPMVGSAGETAFAAVSISDTGVGIPPAQISKIFEPFYTTKEIGKGTGLGLSQVYGFAKQSGGDVTVESVVGEGTTFTLLLPQTQRRSKRGDVPIPIESEDECAGKRVLVVEDNPEVGAFCTQLLDDLGYGTAWARDAAGAISLLQNGEPIDVVFSDVMMPGMSGIELARRLADLFPSLPVVLTSGYSEVLAQDGHHGFELLQKPYAVEDLSRVLRRAMRRHRLSGVAKGLGGES